jgi:hypothetical protein
VAKIEPDVTDIDTTAFDYGKLVHLLLETVQHRQHSLLEFKSVYQTLASRYATDSEYRNLHPDYINFLDNDIEGELSPTTTLTLSEILKAIASAHAYTVAFPLPQDGSGNYQMVVELPLTSETFIGYVDGVLINTATNEVDIVDIKTTAGLYDSYIKKQASILSADPQLSLYVHHFRTLKHRLNPLDSQPAPFTIRNCRYRSIGKSQACIESAKVKKTKDSETGKMTTVSVPSETHLQFMERILRTNAISVVEFVIPVELIDENIGENVAIHNGGLKMVEKLRRVGNPASVPCNRANCYAYNRPCEWLSKCHPASSGGTSPAVTAKKYTFEERE